MIERMCLAIIIMFSASFAVLADDGSVKKEAEKIEDEADDESVEEAEEKDEKAAEAVKDSEKAVEDTEEADEDEKDKQTEKSDRALSEADTSSNADARKENKDLVEDDLNTKEKLEEAKKEEKKALNELQAAGRKIIKPKKSKSPRASGASDSDAPAKRSLWARIGRSILLYIPNRLIDATDIITAEVGVGPEIVGQVQATNYMKMVGFCGEKYFLKKGYCRQYGGGHSEGWELDLLCMTKSYRYVDNTFGTVEEYAFDHPYLHFASFDENIYNDRLEDFWAIGGRVGWLFNIGIGVHPLEIVDVITGIFFIDLMNDDFEDSAALRVK